MRVAGVYNRTVSPVAKPWESVVVMTLLEVSMVSTRTPEPVTSPVTDKPETPELSSVMVLEWLVRMSPPLSE